ncbi:MAG: phosphodiester glycosidase family protein [Desulfovibrio sp.]|nr:phosphodiester glycosidase family protein [Desulfovibrio sp.]
MPNKCASGNRAAVECDDRIVRWHALAKSPAVIVNCLGMCLFHKILRSSIRVRHVLLLLFCFLACRSAVLADTAAETEHGGWLHLEPGLAFGEFPVDDGQGHVAAVRLDPAFFDFVLCSRSEDGGGLRSLHDWGEQYDLTAAVNASMYLPDAYTSTGYMRQGKHINNGRIARRFGGFFVAGPDSPDMPPAAIIEQDNPGWRRIIDRYNMVIQNYRMIAADRHILWAPGGPLYSISAVAEDDAGRILFLHRREPVEAYVFAQQLLHLPLNVRTVMYVEGGGQAGLLLRSAALTREMRGKSAADFLITGNSAVTLPNVLGARKKQTALQSEGISAK